MYSDIPPGEVAAAHAHAARLMAGRGAPPERVALHLLATDPAGDETTVQTLGDAAQRALDRAAPEAAFRYLERALAEPASEADRPRLVSRLMTAAIRSGLGRDAVEEIAGDAIAELSADDEVLVGSAWELAMARDEGAGAGTVQKRQESGPLGRVLISLLFLPCAGSRA